MKIIKVKNYEEMSDAAFQEMKEVVSKNPNAILGLATGSTPIGLYERMITDHQQYHTSYAKCQSFNLDEYVGLPQEHAQSYWTFMQKHLFERIDIPKSQIHIPYGNSQKDCEAYEQALNKVQVDIQVLGIGSNGHIGFNEPNTPFTQETHIINLAEKTRQDNARFFDGDIEKVPTQAITMGIASIMKAKKILLLASGLNKADAIATMVYGTKDPICPATVLQDHSDVVIIVDEAAASKL